MKREDLAALKMPDAPGVYQFRGADGKILYVGKAASLRDRVRSYFSRDLAEARSAAVAAMVAEANTATWIETDSVLEALILEANLIKKEQPPYNVASKDNKSFNYLIITKECFPRVLVVRGRELFQKWNAADIKKTFGPYPHGLQLKAAMKIVRKIFPFRDSTCTPCEDQKYKDTPRNTRSILVCKPCFNKQIGLCPGVCTGEMTKADYKLQVKHICELFSGNFKGLKRQLSKEMKEAAKAEEFEKAARLRRQCEALEHIRDVSLIKEDRMSGISTGGGLRIESYDVAHTAGQETVAVMTVVDNGEPIKDAYRKFTIRTAANNDVAALSEAIGRRLAHSEWALPRVFVIDGGKAQVRAIERLLKEAAIEIPVVGVTKNEFHRPEMIIGNERIARAHEADILLANAEAHRFALEWHRKRLGKRLVKLQKGKSA